MDVLKAISDIGVIPVIKIEDLETALPLANALREGGINTIEVTARNDLAFRAIEKIRKAFPDMLVGAGTITSADKANEAISVGARYIVSPGFNLKTVCYCQEHGLPIVPGCVTPTEIEAAMEAGLSTLKFFPSEDNGGVKTMKNLSGPFGGVKFVPTGGIDFSNMGAYLQWGFIAAVGGSFMAPADLIRQHNWAAITANCRRAIQLALGFELAHVGLNHDTEEEAVANAVLMDERFLLGTKVGGRSTFAGKAVEFMHTQFYGAKGHIGYLTNSVERAKAFFESRDIAIREESIRYDQNGKMTVLYLKDEIGGFALHVVGR